MFSLKENIISPISLLGTKDASIQLKIGSEAVISASQKIGEDYMSKVFKNTQNNDELAALEIIELACDDLDSLSRAFEMITQVCSELSDRQAPVETVEIPYLH